MNCQKNANYSKYHHLGFGGVVMGVTRKLVLIFLTLVFVLAGLSIASTGQTEIISIAEARKLDDGVNVTVRGVVTSTPGNWGGGGFYIQDDTGGIYIWEPAPSDIHSPGDTVIVAGELATYNGERQVQNVSITPADVALDQPEPVIMRVADLSLDNEGLLIQLQQVEILEIKEVNVYGTFEMIVADETGKALVRVDNRIGITYEQFDGEAGDFYTLTGIIGQFRGALQVKPRDPDELVKTEPPIDPGVAWISDVRELPYGTDVTVIGVVTAPDTMSTRTFYVQDKSAGIMVHYPSNLTFDANYGDQVRIEGITGEFNGEKQIVMSQLEVVEEDVQVPEPKVTSIAGLDENEGLLVKLERVTIRSITTYSSGSSNVDITDETGSTILRIEARTGIDVSGLEVGEEIEVIGISCKYQGTPQIKARFQNDIIVLPPEDVQEPVVYRLTPSNLASTYDTRPAISAMVTDDHEIDWESVEFFVNDQDVSYELMIDRETGFMQYVPSTDLTIGDQTVRISVSNVHGLTATRSWRFSVIQELDDYQFILGVPHSHTSFSDGAGTPEEAYEFAMSQNIDFLIVTDHSNWFEGDVYDPERNQFIETEGSEWHITRMQAEAFNAEHGDSFSALRGFEMTFQDVGHINVYNTTNYVERNTMSSLFDFYNWLLDVYEEEGEKVLAAFCHPNWPSDSFNNLAYVPELDKIIQMIEVANGAPPYSYTRAEGHFIKALDQGWHVAPINAQDNHARNWGEPDNLTGLVVVDNTPEEILSAMRARRVYATETRGLEMTFKANGYWMGSVVSDEVLDFTVELFDPDVPIETVEVVTTGGNVLKKLDVGGLNHIEWSFSHKPAPGRQWFYVRVTHVNGAMAWSSPIFTPPGDVDVKLIDLVANPHVNIPGAPTEITATVANMGVFAASDIAIEFFVGGLDEEHRVVTKIIDTLHAGRQARVSTEVVFGEPGDTRVFATLHTVEDDLEITATLDRGIKVVPSIGKNMLLDVHHNNDYAPGTLLDFIEQMRFHGYNVILNRQPFSPEVLEDIDVVILTQPSNTNNLSSAEEDALAAWVRDGGSLLLAGKSNYGNDPTMVNPILEKLEAAIRINNDNVYETDEANYTGGMIWSVLARTFPPVSDRINENMEYIRIFSSASLVSADIGPLSNDPEIGLEILVKANPTAYNFNVQPGYYTYNEEGGDQGHNIPLVARQFVGDGRLVVMGRALFSDFELANNFANDRLIQELVDWLADYPRAITIEEARTRYTEGDLVTVKGVVTSPTDHFFDVFYIQDDTGGIAVYGAQAGTLPIGTEVMVTGTLLYFEGEMELAYDDWGVQIMKSGPTGEAVEPLDLPTADAMQEKHQGKLITTTGQVKEIDHALGTIIIDDGSGPALMYIDGYLGIDISDIKVGQTYQFTGMGSHGSMGPRLRIRFQEDIVQVDAP